MYNQTSIIVLGALIPLLVVFESSIGPLNGEEHWAALASALISAVISIIAGLDKLNQPQTNWFNYRSNEEMLKKEEWMFNYKAGPYAGLKDKEADVKLVTRVESVISADVARFSQTEPEPALTPKADHTESVVTDENNIINE